MAVEESSAAVLLAGFGSWLAGERGLSRETVRCYGSQASIFLASLPDPVDAAVRELDSGRIIAFMVDYCRDRNTWSAKAMATAVRALLRFLHVRGKTPTLLAGAVPGVAGWAVGVSAARAGRRGGGRNCSGRATARRWWGAATMRS